MMPRFIGVVVISSYFMDAAGYNDVWNVRKVEMSSCLHIAFSSVFIFVLQYHEYFDHSVLICFS
jgi:hypothetical protein